MPDDTRRGDGGARAAIVPIGRRALTRRAATFPENLHTTC